MDIIMNDEFTWDTGKEKLDIVEMRTTYLINVVKSINRKAKSNSEYEHPKCYDFIYKVLNARGVDTDDVIDSIYDK